MDGPYQIPSDVRAATGSKGGTAVPDNKIIFRGASVVPSWPVRIVAAQLEHEWSIDGKLFPRVRYGEEADDWGADRAPCHDCAVIKGEFHVPGCDVERCPSCDGQVIGCDCFYDDEEDE
jgi:hypothetical protein